MNFGHATIFWRSAMTPADVVKMIKEKEVKYADLRFTDTRGKEQHVTVPSRFINEEFFVDGKMFDGSSIAGWKGINESDMILMPDASTASATASPVPSHRQPPEALDLAVVNDVRAPAAAPVNTKRRRSLSLPRDRHGGAVNQAPRRNLSAYSIFTKHLTKQARSLWAARRRWDHMITGTDRHRHRWPHTAPLRHTAPEGAAWS